MTTLVPIIIAIMPQNIEKSPLNAFESAPTEQNLLLCIRIPMIIEAKSEKRILACCEAGPLLELKNAPLSNFKPNISAKSKAIQNITGKIPMFTYG